MSDEEPRAIAEHVEAARAAIQGRGRRWDPDEMGEDLEDVELDEMVGTRSIERAREMHWLTICPQRFHLAELTEEYLASVPEIAEDLAAWAKHPQGRNLVLFGPTGTGKTHAVTGACREAHRHGLTVVFLPVVELLDLLRPGGPEHALDKLMAVDRLILDDLGAEKATDWTAERLYALVNRRWLEERPTAITTNLEIEDLRDETKGVGERLFSRIAGSDAVVLRMSGKDWRFDRG